MNNACRSCGAQIVWALSAKNKRIPVDPDAVPHGNVILSTSSGVRRARVLGAGEAPPTGEPRYRSHFATCPSASQHRRSR